MAENTGVTHTEPRPHGDNRPAGGSLTKGKNKKWLYIGGAGVALLLLGHKGSQANAGSSGLSQGQLDAAAQAQTDAAMAAGNSAPGGVAPTTIEGDNASVTYPAANVTVPQQMSDDVFRVGRDGAAPDAALALEAADTSLDAAEVAKHAPNEAPKHKKPKPTGKDGKHHHPSEGAKVQGHTGHTVHGKTFPGATGHTTGGSRTVNGKHHQDVTIHYGGHSEKHTSVNHGEQWIENKKGGNPPGRGPQHTTRPTGQPPVEVRPGQQGGHNAAPHPAPRPGQVPASHPAPAPTHTRKPAPRRR